jgi:hypothetical protein
MLQYRTSEGLGQQLLEGVQTPTPDHMTRRLGSSAPLTERVPPLLAALHSQLRVPAHIAQTF